MVLVSKFKEKLNTGRTVWDKPIKFEVDDGDEHLIEKPNTVLLPFKRKRLLRYLPNKSKIAEIGVARGKFSAQIRRICQPRQLMLIDPWEQQDEGQYFRDANNVIQGTQQNRYQTVSRRFVSKKLGRECRVLRKYSNEAVSEFEDGEFDWVYIDANHSLEACLEDLRDWAPKVKDDGFICGHDYSCHGLARKSKFGVIEAVDMFLAETGFSLLALTVEQFPTYIISKNPVNSTAIKFRKLLASFEPVVIQLPSISAKNISQARLLKSNAYRATLFSISD